jgi:Zn-dependent protease
MFCQDCGAPLADDALVCDQCQRLVHATALESLAAEARAATQPAARREFYQRMLKLLPPGSSQYQAIQGKLAAETATEADAPPPKPSENSTWGRILGSLGVVGAILWKFKGLLALVLTKGKFVLFGLTKMKTLLSMFASMGVYWALYGWRYAVGIVISIYIHEMGHMWAFRRFGVPASAPMFIPMFGAFIRGEAPIPTPYAGARIGLAGPWWGFGAAVLFELASQATGERWLSAVAHTGAVINLFNMLPVFGLDGHHAYQVLNRTQRGMALATMFILWFLSGETMFFIVSLGAIYRMFTKDAPTEQDHGLFWQYVGLLAAFGMLSMISAHWDRQLLGTTR